MAKSNAPPENPTVTKQRIGDALFDRHLIDPRQLRLALTTQSQTGDRLGSILIEMGFLTLEDLLDFLEQRSGVPAVNLCDIRIDKPFLDLITKEKIFNARVLSITADKHTLTLAMVNPHDFETVSEIGFTVGKR